MNTFKNDQYTITTSLNERSAIYVKIVNNISYMCYEGNFDSASFKLPFELRNIYELVNKCFAAIDNGESDGEEEDSEEEDEEEDEDEEKVPHSKHERNPESYVAKVRLDNGMLQLVFHCVVGGFLNVKFDLRLREKLMSNDAQLSLNFQRVEQNQTKALERIDTVASQIAGMMMKMKEMERRLEALGHADICFTSPPSQEWSKIRSLPIGCKTLYVNSESNSMTTESFEKIKHFYRLEELHIHRCDWVLSSACSNATVKKLKIQHSSQFNEISFIKNFPELEELEMVTGKVDASIVATLRSIKHKIRKFTFQQITGINQTEMQTYCTQKGITLNLS